MTNNVRVYKLKFSWIRNCSGQKSYLHIIYIYTSEGDYLSTKQPILSHQFTKAFQCLSPSRRVSASPKTTKPLLARVIATFIRRQSFKKPIRPSWLDLTAEKMIRSRSLP